MATGTIKTKTDRGFGFLSVVGSPDVFFHSSACNGQFESFEIGQSVDFDLEQGEKGPKASNVVASGGGTKMSKGDQGADADMPEMSQAA